MPSLNSRAVDLSATHVQRRPEQLTPVLQPTMPTPLPIYMGRHPRMISSMPPIFATRESAIRQFYGRNLPMGRVSQV